MIRNPGTRTFVLGPRHKHKGKLCPKCEKEIKSGDHVKSIGSSGTRKRYHKTCYDGMFQ